ncbi:MAG: O-antigen ligase family protein, partial [Verrucomicrobiota bacterium]
HKIQSREPFSIPRVPVIAILIAFGLSSLQLLNPQYTFSGGIQTIVPVEGANTFLPGVFNRTVSIQWLLHTLALAAAFVTAVELMQSRKNRWRLLTIVAVAGLLVASIGVFQKVSNAQALLWTSKVLPDYQQTFFAAFRYHANAAAFLNLCWPVSIALLIRGEFDSRWTSLTRTVWINASVLTFAALFANTSKFGHLLAIIGIVLVVLLIRKNLPYGWRWNNPVFLVILPIIIGVIGIAAYSTLARSAGNWSWELSHGGSLRGRLLAYEACLTMIKENLFFGIGPGSFELAFPFYTGHLGEQIRGIWSHAHQDYLQVVIEWGLFGATCWFVVAFGGLRRGFQARRWQSLSANASIAALILVGIHSLVDFPLQIPAIQFYAVLHLACLWSVKQMPAKKKESGK